MLAPGDPITALTELPRWVGWRNEPRRNGGKPTKVPYAPGSGRHAATDDPATWSTYPAAVAMRGCDGPGLVLTGLDDVAAVDLDGCRNPQTGRIEPWALEYCERAQSYVELSPSGCGLHIFGLAPGIAPTIATLPQGPGQQCEVFAGGATKYVTVTFQRLEEYPAELNDISGLVAELLARARRPKAAPEPARAVDGSLADRRLATLANDYGRADWVRIALAHRAAGGSFETFNTWSARHPTYDPAETTRVWQSLKPERISGRTIAYEARRQGVAEPPAELETETLTELLAMDLPPLREVVPGYLCEGLTVLGGKPKLGKSFLMLGLGLAVATGGYAFGSIKVDQGDVLLLALEDNRRRMRRRAERMLPALGITRADRLWLSYRAQRLDEGGLDAIRAWIEQAADPRLVIVDVLNRFRPAQKPTEGLYDFDVRSLAGLQTLATERGVAIVVVHHTRKAEAEDPFDCLSGSTGLTGTADATLVLARHSAGFTLYGRGRDIEEIETALACDRSTGVWTILGKAADVRRSGERAALLAVLREAQEPLPARDIASLAGMKPVNVRRLLGKMVTDREVTREKRGRYRCAGPVSDLLSTPGHIGNNGNNRPAN